MVMLFKIMAKPSRAIMLLLGLGVMGCSQITRVEQAEQGERSELDDFLHLHLQQAPMVTVAEAYRAMLYLADGEEKYDDFAAREAALFQRGIARPEWELQPAACIDRGSVAYMVCKICRIRGGLNYTLFGGMGIGDRRYAVRELVYRRMLSEGADYRYLSGAEMVSLMAKADAYMAERGLYQEESVDITRTLQIEAPAAYND